MNTDAPTTDPYTWQEDFLQAVLPDFMADTSERHLRETYSGEVLERKRRENGRCKVAQRALWKLYKAHCDKQPITVLEAAIAEYLSDRCEAARGEGA